MMNQRENSLRAIRFERPESIPMSFHINAACWQHYPQEQLFDLMEAHPLLFPDFVRPALPYRPEFALVARRDSPYKDDFGCVWETAEDGITGTVTGHPLADWSAFESWQAPDPEVCTGIGPVDWKRVAADLAADRAAGRLAIGGLRHGHTFLQLCDLRGYQNLLYDMVDEEPRLLALIDQVEAFNRAIVSKYIAFGADVITFAEDLGMQKGPMVSPELFRIYIRPSYARLMQPVRDQGFLVHMHSDGHLHDLIEDILAGGVDIINLQDLVNGIDWIAGRFAGKTCVELDIDRQAVTTFGSPRQIDALIRSEVSQIGRKEGGLMMIYGLYPGVPLDNVAALMDAMERYAGYYT